MGVGEEALGAHLASEGWSLKPGVLAHFGEREDLASARNALLDTDLRRVGEPIVRAGDAYLAGPVVLQVVAVRDISRPARDSRDPSGAASAFGNGRTKGSGAARTSSTKTKSSRMLRVELTDGDARLVAVEHEPLRFVKDEASVPPGSKVLVPKDVVVRKVNGVLLLRGDDEFVPLGGRVASLFRDWERARARRGRDDTSDENSAGKDAPAYRPYDPGDTAAVEAAAEKRRAEAKRVADEAASAAVSAAAAAAAAEAESRAAADSEAAFVPRRRPALPPTRAQRAAAVASGEALPRPGEPMPLPHPSAEALATISAENENENENETKAPVEARARPALPPRRREAPPAAPPPVPPDADARRRELLLSRLVEPSRGGAGGGDRGEGRGGGGGRGGRRGGGGRRDGRGGRGRGRDNDDDDDNDDGFVTFEQHVSRRGRGDDDASEALARQLHRELNVDAARDASSDLAASLFAFPRPVADEGRGDRGGARGARTSVNARSSAGARSSDD